MNISFVFISLNCFDSRASVSKYKTEMATMTQQADDTCKNNINYFEYHFSIFKLKLFENVILCYVVKVEIAHRPLSLIPETLAGDADDAWASISSPKRAGMRAHSFPRT